MRLVILSLAAAMAVAAPAAAADSPVSVVLAPNEVLLEVSGAGIVQTPADRILVTVAGRSTATTIAAVPDWNSATSTTSSAPSVAPTMGIRPRMQTLTASTALYGTPTIFIMTKLQTPLTVATAT